MLSGSLLIPGLQATLGVFFVVCSGVFLMFCVVCFFVCFLCFLGAECASSVVNSSRIRCFTFCVKSHLLMLLGLFWGPAWEPFWCLFAYFVDTVGYNVIFVCRGVFF